MSFFGSPDTRTRVYIALTEHGVACRLPYVVRARSRRTAQRRQLSRLLKAPALEGIAVASAALRVVRCPVERTWKELS